MYVGKGNQAKVQLAETYPVYFNQIVFHGFINTLFFLTKVHPHLDIFTATILWGPKYLQKSTASVLLPVVLLLVTNANKSVIQFLLPTTT